MMEKLPPTETALLQHANRCLYQASIWRNSEAYLWVDKKTPDGVQSVVPTTLPAAYVGC